jgi:hypothetical protein
MTKTSLYSEIFYANEDLMIQAELFKYIAPLVWILDRYLRCKYQSSFRSANVLMEACRHGTKIDSRSARILSNPLLVLDCAKAWHWDQKMARAILLGSTDLSMLMLRNSMEYNDKVTDRISSAQETFFQHFEDHRAVS